METDFEGRSRARRRSLPRRLGIGLVLALGAGTASAAPVEGETPQAPTFRVTVLVTDAVTGSRLAGARIAAANRHELTDAKGRAVFALGAGPWTLEVSAEGYASARTEVKAEEGPTLVEILLVPLAAFQEQVVVSAPADVSSDLPSTTPVAPRDVVSVAGGAENVFRVLQTLPGVSPTDDFSSRLSVRGGGPDQNLTVMDGVEVYNPFRLFGLASAFNPETVESFELSTGAFSARHGDRLSSLLVVDTRAGSTGRSFQGSGALSLTDTNLILEGRLPAGRGSWLVTGRRTYYDLVAERFTDSDLPSFADLQAKTVWTLGGGRSLSFFTLRSRERTDATFDVESEAAVGAIFTRTRNDLATATFRTPLGSRGWSRTVASHYVNTDSVDFDGRFRDEARRSNAPDDSGFGVADLAITWDGTVRDTALRQEVGLAWGGDHVVETGFEVHGLHTRLGFTFAGDRNDAETNGSSWNGGASLPDLVDRTRSDTRVGAWLLDRWQATDRLVIEPGVRLDRSTINERASVTPRLAATWALDASTRLRAAFGIHTQSPGYEKLVQGDYFVELTDDGSLPLESERARHVLLSLERDLPGGVLTRLEGYYKSFDRLIVGRLETPGETAARLAEYDFPAELASSVPAEPWITSFPTNEGRGRGWGFDLYVSRRAPKARLGGWASYTFGVAEREGYGRTYPFDYDRRHAVSMVGTFRVTPKLELSATARLASGFPDTPVLGLRVAATPDDRDADGDGDREELVPQRDPAGRLVYALDRGGVGNLNASRLPHYARLDARATFTPGWGRGRVRLYLDFINVLNRKNAGIVEQTLEHDPSSDRPRVVSEPGASIPFLPSFGVHVDFGGPSRHRDPKPQAPPCGPPGQACPGETPRSFAISGRPLATQGLGLELVRSLVPGRLNARVGFGLPSDFTYQKGTDGTEYDVTLKLGTASALVDWHPFAGRLRLSSGVFATRHGFELRARDAESYDLGGVRYPGEQVGVLEGAASVRRVGPYVGLGWGNAVGRKRGFSFGFDLGVLSQGAPEVTLAADGPASAEAAFAGSLARETDDLARALRGWRFFPVFSMSVSFRP